MTVPGSNDSCAYRARPPFALERLEANGYGAPGGERIVYRLPHPAPDCTTALSLTPLEFLERLALLISPRTGLPQAGCRTPTRAFGIPSRPGLSTLLEHPHPLLHNRYSHYLLRLA